MKSGEMPAREAKGSTNYKRTKMKRQIRVIINERNKGVESRVSVNRNPVMVPYMAPFFAQADFGPS